MIGVSGDNPPSLSASTSVFAPPAKSANSSGYTCAAAYICSIQKKWLVVSGRNALRIRQEGSGIGRGLHRVRFWVGSAAPERNRGQQAADSVGQRDSITDSVPVVALHPII